MLTFRDSNKSFKLDENLLETKSIYDFSASHSNPKDQKVTYDFGKVKIKQKGRKITRDKSMIKLLESPAIMASGISNLIFLPSDPNELCDRSRFLLQQKQAKKNWT